ncbi:MAG TPA: hypothetical protein VFM68_00995 [Candidatus Saccharimonadales bacterium]|nr:hypothetical protein [Candidatus Saccharimonadales bacterium]
MQPKHDPTEWKQPTEQPAQTPYVAVPDDTPREAAVVTLTPDAPVDAVPLQSMAQSQTSTADSQADRPDITPIRWQAQEYIQHDKSPVWYIAFALVVLGLMAVAIFFIRSITFNILVPVMAIALWVYVNRPPRVLDYTLSRKGLHVNDHLYAFSEFKGFGVIHDGKEYSVLLLPVKRFKPGVSVYFPEASGEAIVDMLGARLPMQELHLDIVDRIIRKLRI